MISQFDFNVVGLCRCPLKVLQFFSSATGFLVFLTLFGYRNSRYRAQVLHHSMHKEDTSVIF